MTDAQMAQLIINLRRWEAAVPWMYLDNAAIPNVTVGIGVMLPHASDAVALPFMNLSAQRGATENEIAQAFARVRMMRGSMHADYYKGVTDIELTPQEVTALAVRRLNDVFLPAARAAVPGFDNVPWPAQQALVDVEWNAGGLRKWPKLCAAVCHGSKGDPPPPPRDGVPITWWDIAADESHVSTSRQSRNDWRAAMLRSCATGSVAA